MASDHTVLLVEPNAGASALERTLGDDRWSVIRPGALAEAMERAKREQPSAIVFRGALDDAVALVKKLRCNARTALLPAVIVADASDGARQELARWGVNTVLDPAAADREIADAVRLLAPLPPAEQAPDSEIGRANRLRSLERANLLDTAPEEPFDGLARLTAQLLDVPVVLMSLVDRGRQFFKAQVGLPEPLSTTRQTPITHSFCQWVVTSDEALIVEDARRDLLLSANPATVEMGIVAYAGVPLRAEADETIGSFCAIDMKPRQWDARELRALYDVAHVAQGLTVLRQAKRAAAAHARRISLHGRRGGTGRRSNDAAPRSWQVASRRHGTTCAGGARQRSRSPARTRFGTQHPPVGRDHDLQLTKLLCTS